VCNDLVCEISADAKAREILNAHFHELLSGSDACLFESANGTGPDALFHTTRLGAP